MSNPSVTMVALYADRPQFIGRALASFRAQTYKNKWLLIYDNGTEPFKAELHESELLTWELNSAGAISHRSIGTLRNEANAAARSDIIIHADIDDWSHPNRIAEQVALLQASGKECVGYRDMLFWRTDLRHDWERAGEYFLPDEAWLYTNGDTRYCLGTSLCYWRKTWERRPFPDAPKQKGASGEDSIWLREVDSLGVHGIGSPIVPEPHPPDEDVPRMIASIHGENTSDYPYSMQDTVKWKRAPEWDDYCRARMSLEGN